MFNTEQGTSFGEAPTEYIYRHEDLKMAASELN